jgi:lipid-binding SYLF domain-containing protein
MRVRSALVLIALPLIACSHEQEPKSSASVSSADSANVADSMARLDNAISVVAKVGEKLPAEVARNATCVVVVPEMLKGGLVVGARQGKGFATCRTASGWSAPAPIDVSGGSFGAQIGLESVDLVMVVMNDDGRRKLLRSKLTLGADASVAAGPVGRGRAAETDQAMKAEMLSYTASRGLFAGAELNGAVIDQDADTTSALYGGSRPVSTLLSGDVKIPPKAQPFVDAVRDMIKRRSG